MAMSTATKTQPSVKAVARPRQRRTGLDLGVDHCVLYDISWETYEKILRDLDNRRVFLTYDEGTLEIMSPSKRHEEDRALLEFLLQVYAFEMGIPFEACGSLTMRRKKRKKGLEPDACFYIANAPLARGMGEWNESSVAPDLAIEIEVSHRLGTRREIYAALGVQELWLDDGKSLRVMHLENGQFVLRESSLNFPRLRLQEFESFLRLLGTRPRNEIIADFYKWLRQAKKKS